jgi:hypothetical protein
MSNAAEQYFPINALIHVHQAGVVPDIASSKKMIAEWRYFPWAVS